MEFSPSSNCDYVQPKHCRTGHPGEPTLIQLIPRRTWEPNGVADYAVTLARALRDCSGINTLFLSGTPFTDSSRTQDDGGTVSLPKQNARVLEDKLQSLTAGKDVIGVLLHFSGYGYQKRGVPLWLVNGLRRWRTRQGKIPLITIFHELYAAGRPWESSFWLAPVQKWIARDILLLSSRAIVTTDLCGARLVQWTNNSGSGITCMSVFSNVGEPGCGLPPGARPATAVVFGLAGVEDRIFGIYRREVERLVILLRVERIIDIGPRLSQSPTELAGIPVIPKGALSHNVVSDLLKHARFGFAGYPFHGIGKSGVFAAYAAHGVVPIVLSENLGHFNGVEPGLHCLDGLRLNTDVDQDDLAYIQAELYSWYASHSARVQAGFLENSINELQGASECARGLIGPRN